MLYIEYEKDRHKTTLVIEDKFFSLSPRLGGLPQKISKIVRAQSTLFLPKPVIATTARVTNIDANYLEIREMRCKWTHTQYVEEGKRCRR